MNSGIENELLTQQLSRRIETPVVPIVHDLNDVNEQLSRGRPFFIDVAKDGIVLYEKPGHPLAQPKPLTAEEAKAEAQDYFQRWFGNARKFLEGAQFFAANGDRNHAAFMLHQACENYYHCVLLTLTLYSPKSHRIKVLRSRAEDIEGRLISAWPRDNRFSRRCFELLSRAYVEARYSPNYKISSDELEWLVEHIKQLQAIVEAVCTERLA